MAYTIIYKGHFDSAHYLQDYIGECKNLHGHRFYYEVNLKFIKLDKVGMAIDFHEIGNLMGAIEDMVDHRCLNEVLPFNPTAENLAKWMFDEVEKILPGKVSKIVIWESDKAGVEYAND